MPVPIGYTFVRTVGFKTLEGSGAVWARQFQRQADGGERGTTCFMA